MVYHFLHRIGRSKWAPYIMPITCGVVPCSYLTYNNLLNFLAPKFLRAERAPGQPEYISDHLLGLIGSTVKDLEGKINVPVLDNKLFKHEAKTLWFCSSTLDPITVGMFEGHGAVIGLPNYLNYSRPEELPRSLLEFRKLRLFKFTESDQEREDRERSEEKRTGDKVEKAMQLLFRFNPETPEGKDYVDSLLLSDRAKKFIIARELFMADSYKPLIVTGIMMITLVLGYSVARLVVFKRRLMESHISHRLGYYLGCTMLSYGSYAFLNDSAVNVIMLEADRKAAMLSPDYKLGAEEYFEKTLKRNKMLSMYNPAVARKFDTFGNYRNTFFRQKYFPLTGRLEKIRNLNFETEEKA